MNEFINRIEAQRRILQVVNRVNWETEELFGLSAKAIERWVGVNRVAEPRLIDLVSQAAAKLFFLANKSQEQVSPEYRATAREVTSIASAIESEVKKGGSTYPAAALG